MIERLIKQALETELAIIQSDPRRIELYLRSQTDLTQSEVDGIRTYFLAHPVSVILNYPRQQEPTFPMYAVILAEEHETQPFIGDSLGVLNYDAAAELGVTPFAGSDVLGFVQVHKFHIQVMTEENPDLTLYYYHIAKAAMLRQSNALRAAGLHWLRFSGRDFMPDPRYMPAHVFVRQLTIECQSTMSVIGDIPADYFTSVDGIYVGDVPPVIGVNAEVDATTLLDPDASSG